MFSSQAQFRYVALYQKEVRAKAAYHARAEQALATKSARHDSRSYFFVVRSRAKESPMSQIVARYTRYLLTRLASVAFGMNMN